MRARRPATKPLGGKARGAPFCKGSGATTQEIQRRIGGVRTCHSGERRGERCSLRILVAIGDQEGAARHGTRLQHCRCRRICETRHADQVEHLGPADRTIRRKRGVERLHKCRFGRSDDAAIGADDTQHPGMGAAIVVEVVYGMAERRARIEPAELLLKLQETGKTEHMIGGTGWRPADKQRDRRRRAGNGWRIGRGSRGAEPLLSLVPPLRGWNA